MKVLANCHPTRPHHAKGMCQSCYSHNSHKKYYADAKYRQKALSRSKEWATKNVERVKLSDRNKQYKKKYNITLEEYNLLLSNQKGVCALCKNPETVILKRKAISSLAVDHDHKTGKIRGLLCFKCNIALGFYEKNKEILSFIETYLKKGAI